MSDRLTQRQNEAYEVIRAYVREHRTAPTLKEIGEAMGIRSSNGVYKLLVALEQKGYIEREKHTARGIRLVEEESDPFALDAGLPSLPVVSRTDSAAPHTLWQRPGGYLTLDPRVVHKARDPDACLLGRAGDDGMTGAGIQKGDLLVIEERPWRDVPTGALVGALVGTTLQARTFTLEDDGRWTLRPADRTYAPATFAPDTDACYLIGPVLGVLRLL
jgi:repressor LexA